MLPKISIVTPSYNQGQFIEETILSIINQDYPNLEYIVIDGGSTDNSVEIIKKYSNKIYYWISEKDSGQADAINKGFKKATGEIINWINSDDQLVPGALKKIADSFAANPNAVMIHGRIEYFGESINSFYSRNLPRQDIQTRYIAHICMPQPATFYRQTLLTEQGLLDEQLHFSMDADLFIRAGLHYEIVQTEDVFARFRLHSTSKSVSSFNKTFLTENAIIFSRVLATLQLTKQIDEIKSLGLFTTPAYLYKTTGKKFNLQKLVFYFLQHRMLTLYHHKEKKEFKRLFRFLLSNYPGSLFSSIKLLVYRSTLFLPGNSLRNLFRNTK
ncbi:MAG: glycosyltransferase family 2 protein [Chitinophagaceae bacterium]